MSEMEKVSSIAIPVEDKRSGYCVSPEDYNTELKEPKSYKQKELVVDFPLYEPDPANKPADREIFKSAEFWLT